MSDQSKCEGYISLGDFAPFRCSMLANHPGVCKYEADPRTVVDIAERIGFLEGQVMALQWQLPTTDKTND